MMFVEYEPKGMSPVMLVLGVGFVGVYWKFVLMVLAGFVVLTGIAWVLLAVTRHWSPPTT